MISIVYNSDLQLDQLLYLMLGSVRYDKLKYHIKAKRHCKWLFIFTLLLPMLNMALLYSIRIRRL